MAVELRDPTSGFRHPDVIEFINSEIFSNGGGPDFYLAFCSKSWNEVEDTLLATLMNQQMPRAHKRACAWSALALGVRVVSSLQEEQAHEVHSLQEQIEEREETCKALVFEMQQMREQRDRSTAQLRFMRASLQQALNQREMLSERLRQAGRSAWADPQPQRIVPDPGTEQHEAAVCFQDQTRRMATRAQGMPYLGTQMPAPDASYYVQGPAGPFAQPMSPPLQMPVPHLFFYWPFSVRFPCSASPPSLVERESAAAAAAMAADVPQNSLSQKGAEALLQGTDPLGINGLQSVTQSPKNRQLQKQKANQLDWEKASESPREKLFGSLHNLIYWVCSQCKTVNLSCYIVCYKCKSYTPPGDESLDLGQTQ